MSKNIYSRPITIKDANDFVKQHHRHHRPTSRNSGKWAISAVDVLGETIGVLIAGNPVSATYMDGVTLEITRLCVMPGAPKGTCSFLLGKCRKIWHTMGGERILTYTLDEESGASLRGAGWEKTAIVRPHKRWTNKSRFDGLLRDDLEIYSKKKLRWECNLKEAV
ncbi:XF1762 family protein [Aeromonas rivipollensis]|uniref:XF1762 family protein n=1 Tax=Aeromonas rivipollensis TaxID=948519 RepID=UPI0038D0536B